ncbi:DUF4231 domain-containing protein [Micromonospora sp. WMMD1128]|uniref:DUF4231 domain-containing protein n=1 Tax=Micromonospora sp. WMMD1128 TaxID=3015150 RepID=UPI00248D151F|nr:DUF4231 domain-containing protein [Micromonospora sp. WMMD1128]WBB74383.1 DUF4231 domain-containing protein [Micromonospora sp. WMMD1128]
MSGEARHLAELRASRNQARHDFASKIADFRRKHGNATLEYLASAARESGVRVQRSQLSDILAGKKTAPWQLMQIILEAMHKVDPATQESLDLKEWREAYERFIEATREDINVPIQTNIFQSGRDYTYIAGGQVVVGATRATSAAGSAEQSGTPDEISEYLSELENEITAVAKAARRRLVVYRTLRFAALAASAVTPAVALLNAATWITAGVGTVAFLSEGAVQLTRLNERAVLDTRRVSSLSREFRMYRMSVGDYASENNYTLLVQRIEEIREKNDNERLDVVQQSFGAHVSTPAADQILRRT